MSDYTKLVDYAAKDALSTGNPNKVVRGSEIDAELDAIETAIATKADASGATLSSATLTTPTLTLKQSASPTPTAEGDIQWDTDDNKIIVGDGASQKHFVPTASVSGDATMSTAGALTIANSAVTAAKLASDAVETAKILNSAVTDAKLASDSVTTAKIANSNVTTAKIADANVTYAKIQNVSAASRLIGRGSAGGAGVAEEISLGTGLSMSGTTLSSSVSSSTIGTPVSASSTAVEFTGIPATANWVELNFDQISTNGSANLTVQIGDSGGFETSGYLGCVGVNGSFANLSSGYQLTTGVTSSMVFNGTLRISKLNNSTNIWAAQGAAGRSDGAQLFNVAGSKALSATLDRIRLTTTGSDTFDAGSVNVAWG